MINDVTPQSQRPRQKRIEPVSPPTNTGSSLLERARAEDPGFMPPEQIATRDEAIQAVISETLPASRGSHGKTSRFSRFKPAWPPSRKQVIIGSILVVVLALGTGTGWALTHHKAAVVAEKPKPVTKQVAKPTPIYSNLSGLQITDASLNQKPVTGVMIENSIDARPQSGLADASVVFEAVAEGGVTRFLALFQDTAPDNVGPIRSARPYYVQWALGFDAAYAHVGGSPDALSDITAWGVHDMNQFYNGSSYHRTSDRAAPHNVYTAISTLNQLEATKGYTSNFTGFTRKSDEPYKAPAPAAAGQTAKPTDTRTASTSIDFGLSGYTYDPHYDYNASTNSYDRSEAGEPHVDANGNKRISPKVVIAIVVPLSQGALDSSGAYYSNYNVVGSGTAYVFQDGTVTTAQWNKASNTAPLTFTDTGGKAFNLNRGQTWISAVTGSNKVVYK